MLAMLELKMQNWCVLPWKLAALAHQDEEVAKRCAREALEAWEGLSEAHREAAHRLTKVFLAPGILREQLALFAVTDAPLADFDDLLSQAARLRFIPVVERSVEAKHSLAHVKGTYRKVTPAYVSLYLRMPAFERGVKRSATALSETVDAFKAARKVRRLVVDLGFERHPTLQGLLADSTVHNTKLWQETAAVLYSADPESQFASFGRAGRANQACKTKQGALRRAQVCGGIPRRANPRYEDVVEKAQLEHLRSTASVGRVYSLPRALLEAIHGDHTCLRPHTRPVCRSSLERSFSTP